jgi:uncharacterized membrane protein
MGELDVVTETVIDRPRDEVAAYAADAANAPEWYENIETADRTGDEQVAFVARFLGKRLAYTYAIREHVPGERLVMSTADGPFPMETTYEWADAPGGGTRMTLRNRGRPAGFSRLAAPFMARAVRRANRKDLDRLKRILEAGE